MEEPKYVTYDSNANSRNNNTIQQELPNSTAILVLGILSIIFAGLIGIILACIALSMSGKARSLYRDYPQEYTAASYSRMNAGRICAIVGLCLVAVLIVGVIIVVFAAG